MMMKNNNNTSSFISKQRQRQRRRDKCISIVALLCFCFAPLYLLMDKYYLNQSSSSTISKNNFTTTTAAKAKTKVEDFINIAKNSGATGILFKGDIIRKYNGPRYFNTTSTTNVTEKNKNNDNDNTNNKNKDKEYNNCTNWCVVTTIYEPSEAVRRATQIQIGNSNNNDNNNKWCTVIVADTKTPKDYMKKLSLMTKTPNEKDNIIIFLSVNDQMKWISSENETKSTSDTVSYVSQFLKELPYQHFGRKNLGYLYAIQHGATLIFDFDDDNLLPLVVGSNSDDDDSNNSNNDNNDNNIVLPPISNTTHLSGASRIVTGPIVLNHHALMGASTTSTTSSSTSSSSSSSSSTAIPIPIPLVNSWPRGFPLNEIQNKATQGRILYENSDSNNANNVIDIQKEIGVMQYVANQNPDLDAIHRLVHPLPIHFQRHPNTIQYESDSDSTATSNEKHQKQTRTRTTGSLMVPIHTTFIPYNAQATLHTYKALWAMLLPISVKGRVSDIWRSYFSQRIFRDIDTSSTSTTTTTTSSGIGGSTSTSSTSGTSSSTGGNGLKIIILPPDIRQERNEHNIIADMTAEEDLYYKTSSLLQFLNDWTYTHTSTDNDNDNDDNDVNEIQIQLQSYMECLWIDLYERDYIGIDDIQSMQLWLLALTEIGYIFPTLQKNEHQTIKDVILMGQYNFGNYYINNDKQHILTGQQQLQQQDQQQNENEVLLLNETIITDLLFWVQKWKQKFHHVQIRGPFSTTLVKHLREKHSINIYSTRSTPIIHPADSPNPNLKYDKGYISPMDNLLITLKQEYYKNKNSTIKSTSQSKIKGVLYVHDDMFVNVTNIFDGINKETTILATHDESTITSNDDDDDDADDINNNNLNAAYADVEAEADDMISRYSYRIHPPSLNNNKTYFTKVNGFYTDNPTALLYSLESWEFNWLCLHTMINVTNDLRSYKYMNHSSNSIDERGDDFYFTVPIRAQSDFLYIPTSLTKEYMDIAQILIDHNVFLECGFPIIINELLKMKRSDEEEDEEEQQNSKKQKIRKRKKSKVNDDNDDNDNTATTATATTTAAAENTSTVEIIELKSINLCTSWDYVNIRGTLSMIEQCARTTRNSNTDNASDKAASDSELSLSSSLSSPSYIYSVIHPVKITRLRYETWDRTFDWITTG